MSDPIADAILAGFFAAQDHAPPDSYHPIEDAPDEVRAGLIVKALYDAGYEIVPRGDGPAGDGR